MVKQNLPVGAVFEDGGLYFEVQSVLPDGNYISKIKIKFQRMFLKQKSLPLKLQR